MRPPQRSHILQAASRPRYEPRLPHGMGPRGIGFACGGLARRARSGGGDNACIQEAPASGTFRAGKARAHPLDSWITVFLQEQRRAPASGADSNSSRAAPSAATRPRDDGMCMPSDRRVLSLVTRGYRGVPRCAMLLCPGEWPNGLREVGRGQVTSLQRTCWESSKSLPSTFRSGFVSFPF